MSNIKLITDTGCDMIEELSKQGVEYIPLYITFDGENYLKQLDEISIEEFYNRLNNNDKNSFHPRTSCPSVDDYYNIFTKHISNGDSVLMLCINSNFSGAYQAALLAKNMVLEENPNAEIEVYDTMNCTYTQYLMCLKVCEMIKDNKDISIMKNILDIMKRQSRIFLYVDDLSCLVKGGRLKNVTAQIANVLNIKPILELKDGELLATKKAKGSNKAVDQVIKDVKEFLMDKNINNYKFGIIHGDRYEDALALKDILKNEFDIVGDIDICKLGVCIGVHGGPTVLGIAVCEYNNL